MFIFNSVFKSSLKSEIKLSLKGLIRFLMKFLPNEDSVFLDKNLMNSFFISSIVENLLKFV